MAMARVKIVFSHLQFGFCDTYISDYLRFSINRQVSLPICCTLQVVFRKNSTHNELTKLYCCCYFLFIEQQHNTGNNTRLVTVATNNVTDVSQPTQKFHQNCWRKKIINPAVRTSDV